MGANEYTKQNKKSGKIKSIKTISVLGCGWLGFPLAVYLQTNGYLVKVSATTQEKQSFLKDYFKHPYFLNFSPAVNSDFDDRFFVCDVLIISIPPKIKDEQTARYYLDVIKNILLLIKQGDVKKILFLSTTSVYQNNNSLRKENSTKEDIKNENKEKNNTFQKHTALLKAEELSEQYQKEQSDNSLKNKNLTILRLAGLIGHVSDIEGLGTPSSHFGKSDFSNDLQDSSKNQISKLFSNRTPKKFWKDIQKTPEEIPVNWLHLEDCIKIICEVIQQDAWGEIFNVCSDHHPTKKMIYKLLYPQNTEQISEPSASINHTLANYKVVDNTKIKERLRYAFKYGSPLEML